MATTVDSRPRSTKRPSLMDQLEAREAAKKRRVSGWLAPTLTAAERVAGPQGTCGHLRGGGGYRDVVSRVTAKDGISSRMGITQWKAALSEHEREAMAKEAIARCKVYLTDNGVRNATGMGRYPTHIELDEPDHANAVTLVIHQAANGVIPASAAIAAVCAICGPHSREGELQTMNRNEGIVEQAIIDAGLYNTPANENKKERKFRWKAADEIRKHYQKKHSEDDAHCDFCKEVLRILSDARADATEWASDSDEYPDDSDDNDFSEGDEVSDSESE